MNEASTPHGLHVRTDGSMPRDAISRTAITLYVVAFFAAPFLGIAGWRPYVPMALLALIPIFAGPRAYRLAGVIALLIAIDAGYFEIREQQHDHARAQSPIIPSAK